MGKAQKAKIATPATPAPVQGVPLPVAPVALPTSHVALWRACPALPLSAAISVAATNPWRAGTPGAAFYNYCLGGAHPPATVQGVLATYAALAPALRKSIGAPMPHMRWCYVWVKAGLPLQVNGATFAPAQAATGNWFAPQAAPVAATA